MSSRGCVNTYRSWSEEDRALLRSLYLTEPTAVTAAKLGRSIGSVRREAAVLGISRSMVWTPEMDDRLRELWGEDALKTIAKKLNRTSGGIHQRAADLGLPIFAPDGFESSTAAAVRIGVDIKTLRRILEWAELNGVTDRKRPVERLPWAPRTGKKWRKHVVESFEVDEAVAAWLATETLSGAARSRGTYDSTIKRALRDFGRELPPKLPGNPRRPHRIPTALIDAALAARAETRRAA